MACKAAPVAKAWSDQALRLPGTRFLGICASPQHQTQSRCSGHNAAPACTDRGNFTPGYAHASDTGVPDVATGMRLVHAATQGPGQNTVLYAIYRGVGYYPKWRGGGTFKASGHPDHVHVSHAPGTTFLTPDFGITASKDWFDMATQKQLEDAVRKVLNEGTGKGQTNWAKTNQAILAGVQQCVNLLTKIAKKVGV